MPNREERRARARQERRGRSAPASRPVVARSSRTMNEYDLQERSRRLTEESGEPWTPSGSTADGSDHSHATGSSRHSFRWWIRAACWALIALSAIAFLVAMWLPSHPLWLIIVVSAAFALGVVSLFFISRDPSSNPRLDDNGTAV